MRAAKGLLDVARPHTGGKLSGRSARRSWRGEHGNGQWALLLLGMTRLAAANGGLLDGAQDTDSVSVAKQVA